MKIYEDLYGWKKAQEAYRKAEKKEDAQRPVIPFASINSIRGKLGNDVAAVFDTIQSNSD